MNPVANMNEQRELAANIIGNESAYGEHPEQMVEQAVRLAELVQAQDDWRLKGGFDPYTAAVADGRWDPLP